MWHQRTFTGLSLILASGPTRKIQERSVANADAAAFLILPWFRHVISLHRIRERWCAHCNWHVLESAGCAAGCFSPPVCVATGPPRVFACL